MKTIIRAIFFLLIASSMALSKSNALGIHPKGIKDTAVDFTLEDMNGEKIILSEILKEKEVVLFFWASWCPACRREAPEIERFYQGNKHEITVIGIDVGESKARVERFLKRMEVSFPIALDSTSEVSNLYNVIGIPTIVAVDRDAKIIYYGYSVKEMAETLIER